MRPQIFVIFNRKEMSDGFSCYLFEWRRKSISLSLQAILLSLNFSRHNLGILPISLFSFIYLGTITNNLHKDNGTETREIGANTYNLPRIFHQMSIQSQFFGIFIAGEYDILHRTVYWCSSMENRPVCWILQLELLLLLWQETVSWQEICEPNNND